MYTRLLPSPTGSIFLFGPRGTGKSTWIRDRFPDTVTYDLLDTGEALRLNKDPQALYRELATLPSGSWAVIDEVQKVPALLDEVHRLIESHRLRFVLSGSSARKLRRGGANLLAGRAVTTSMFPLVSAELAFEIDPERALRFGMLPMAITTDVPQDYLRSYAETYLVQEIQAEALTPQPGSVCALPRNCRAAERPGDQCHEHCTRYRNQSPNGAASLRDSDGHVDRILAAPVEAEVGHEAGTAKQVPFLRFRRRPGAERAAFLSADIRGIGPPGRNLRARRAASVAWLFRGGLPAVLLAQLRRCGGRRGVRDGGRVRCDRDQGVDAVGEALQPRPCTGSGTTSGRTGRHVAACTSGSGRRFGTRFRCCPWSIS